MRDQEVSVTLGRVVLRTMALVDRLIRDRVEPATRALEAASTLDLADPLTPVPVVRLIQVLEVLLSLDPAAHATTDLADPPMLGQVDLVTLAQEVRENHAQQSVNSFTQCPRGLLPGHVPPGRLRFPRGYSLPWWPALPWGLPK